MGVLNLRLGSKRPQINSVISIGDSALIISALYTNITHHFSDKWQVRIERNSLICFNYISKIVPWNAWVNELIFEKIAYGGSCKQDGTPGFALKKLK